MDRNIVNSIGPRIVGMVGNAIEQRVEMEQPDATLLEESESILGLGQGSDTLPAFWDKVFQPFFTKKQEGQGTCMGLP